MIQKVIVIVFILLATPSFSEDRIDSYIDENGKTVYYSTGDRKQSVEPQKYRYRSPIIEHHEPILGSDTTSHNNTFIPIERKRPTVSDNFAVSFPPRNRQFDQSPLRSVKALMAFSMFLFMLAAFTGIVMFGLWIYALIDVLKNEFSGSNKMIWILLLILLAPLGTILYLIIGRNQKVDHWEPSGDQEVFIRAYEKPKI